MRKSILNVGKALNKAEQKQIVGGRPIDCYSHPLCPPYPGEACIVIANRFCEYIGGPV